MTARMALALLALAAACSVITDFSPEALLEQTEELCSDSVDNDGNGAVDCADSSCSQFDFCREDTEARCLDGRDNDADGRTDCQDPDCCAQPKCSTEPRCGERTSAACSDGLDNDNNGLTDCADFSCEGPTCCKRLRPLISETFSTVNSACTPPDCASGSANCCAQPVTSCNHFDPLHWIAWGNPPPRVDQGKFTPNQPCVQCAASGILSVEGALLSPNLVLEFEADLAGQPDAMLSVGLVENVPIASSDQPCGGIQAAFPLLAGITITGPQLQTEVAGVVRQVPTGGQPVNQGTQRLRIAVQADGAIVFAHNDRPIDTTQITVQPPYRWVRVLVQGSSAVATVDNVLLARQEGCPSPAAWHAGAAGPDPVFIPSGVATAFDGSSVASPSVLLLGSSYVMYYTGRSAGLAGSKIGYTTSGDGQSWYAKGTALTIHGETSKYLSDPMVLARGDQDYLMVYRSGATSSDAAIVLAKSTDGISWDRVKTILEPGASGTWDDGDISGPSLLEFRHRNYLWYAGSGGSDPVPAVGLAVAGDDFVFTRSKGNPVLKPTVSGFDDRGVSDPWVMLDGDVLHMWYVGRTWGGNTAISYAVSEDGRNWVPFPKNPVIASGDSNLFGSHKAGAPTVLDRWGTLQMWYGGSDPGGLPSIGHAVNSGAP